MAATLDLPLDVTISVLRNAGTGDNLLAALDAMVTVTDETVTDDVVDETATEVEFVNVANVDEVVTEDQEATVELTEG